MPETNKGSPTLGAFRPRADMRLPELEKLVRQRSPELQAAALDVDLAEASLQQSRLLPNPVFDFSWNTIPIGPTNPGNDSPSPAIAHVPNYGFGLSYTFPLGKRGPKQRQMKRELGAAEQNLDAVARAKAFELARLLGEMAAATMRREGLRDLVEDAKGAVNIAQVRLDASFGTPLDVDRMRIELSRSEQTLAAADSDVGSTLASCAALVGEPCESFPSADEAKQFLARWTDEMATARGKIEDRPDLRALAEAKRAAEAEGSWARAQGIPDPTVRFGYVHDTYLAAGAQPNSLNLSLAFPITMFDHGQALERAAAAKEERYAAQRDVRIAAARARIPALLHRVENQRHRAEALTSEVLPRAQHVLHDVKSAAEGHLVGVADVIQARRTVAELLVLEADSYRDAFEAALELSAELPAPGAPPPAEEAP